MASKAETVFKGNAVSSGIVLGQALKLDSHNRLILKVRVDDVTEIDGLMSADEYDEFITEA